MRTSRPSRPAITSVRRPSSSPSRTRSRPRRSSRGPTGTWRRHGARVGPDRRVRAQRVAAVLRELPDHAGVGASTSSRHKNFGVITIQAEDEIAAANIALGASFSGPARRHRDERPGRRPEGRDDRPRGDHGAADDRRRRAASRTLDRDADEDRAGRPAARDVRTAHGESPLPIVSASTPADCFTAALEAARIAVRYRTPVILLSDTFIANSSEPGDPRRRSLPTIDPAFASPNGPDFLPYSRDEQLARPWAMPGTPGLVHRIGGLERQDGTGNISYDPANHELMIRPGEGTASRTTSRSSRSRTRAARPSCSSRLGLLLGTITAAVGRARADGEQVATAHLRHLNPFPANTGEVVRAYRKVLIPR